MKLVPTIVGLFALIVVSDIGAASAANISKAQCDKLRLEYREQLRKSRDQATTRRLQQRAAIALADCPDERNERADMEKKRRQMLERTAREHSYSTSAPTSWRTVTQRTIEKLVSDVTASENSKWGAAAIQLFRGTYAGGQGTGMGGQTMGGQVAQLGRFMASQMGVGSCTRHFYNKSDYDWGVAISSPVPVILMGSRPGATRSA